VITHEECANDHTDSSVREHNRVVISAVSHSLHERKVSSHGGLASEPDGVAIAKGNCGLTLSRLLR
jgi:hypothetical protein